ncbi:unnamed protein product, partial [Didymodactylos carnosus]
VDNPPSTIISSSNKLLSQQQPQSSGIPNFDMTLDDLFANTQVSPPLEGTDSFLLEQLQQQLDATDEELIQASMNLESSRTIFSDDTVSDDELMQVTNQDENRQCKNPSPILSLKKQITPPQIQVLTPKQTNSLTPKPSLPLFELEFNLDDFDIEEDEEETGDINNNLNT